MKSLLKIGLLFVLFVVFFWAISELMACGLAAQNKSAYILSETERREWQQFGQSEKQLSTALDQSVINAVNAPVGEQSKEVHAAIQRAWLALNLVRAQRETWLLKLQSDHDCKGCAIEADKLIKK